MTAPSFATRIGTIVQAEHIPSLTGARDIGGAIVTRTGRVVIAAGISDGNLNYPYRIAITDDGGQTVREVFSMPAGDEVTYHTLGLTYDHERHVIVSMFGRLDGYKLLTRDRGEVLPFALERCGDNDAIVVMSWDDGETWHVDQVLRLPKPENSHGMSGCGVIDGDAIVFPHGIGTGDPDMTKWRHIGALACLRLVPGEDGNFSSQYDHRYRVLASNEDQDVPFSSETVYLPKLDGTGFLSFTRNQAGPPYRREYDQDHRPTGEFERCRTTGFDPRDYDAGHNGPLLIAFGITRLADGNLLYASRFYGTDHHRASNIFMTSTDEGRTWDFGDDYVPKSLEPLAFYSSGMGGNPQMCCGPDGRLVHITSEGWVGDPPTGGFYLCRFQGFDIEVVEGRGDDTGTITIDVSTIARLEDVYIGKIVVEDSAGLELPDEAAERYRFCADMTQVSFPYRKVSDPAHVRARIVLANRVNAHRPVFVPRIDISDC